MVIERPTQHRLSFKLRLARGLSDPQRISPFVLPPDAGDDDPLSAIQRGCEIVIRSGFAEICILGTTMDISWERPRKLVPLPA